MAQKAELGAEGLFSDIILDKLLVCLVIQTFTLEIMLREFFLLCVNFRVSPSYTVQGSQ